MSDGWSTLSYVVCGAAMLLSLGVLLLTGWFAQTMVSRLPKLTEWAIAVGAVCVGVAQAAAPAWLLWRTAQGGFGGWGVGLGLASLVVSAVLGAVTFTGLSAAAQP